MSKNDELLFQSQSLKANNTIIWNNNNINGNININNNFSNSINPIKRSGSITFKNNAYNKSVISSPIITPNSSNFKKIRLGANGNKSKPKTKNFSNNHFGIKTEGNQLEMNHAKNYINYLHEHLDTSYNANNELSNKTEMIINMTKDIESEIKRNNDIYKSLILSYNDKLKANNKYKNEFINFLNQYKKQFKSISSEMNNNKNELDELNQKNLALKKEIKDTEDIISYLKKTEDILQNNALTKYKEENINLKEKENKENNEINILNKELNKLIEIKNIGNKDIQNLTKRNIKLKEEINKLENQIKKNKKNNFDEISIGSSSKIRNKKFIIDNNIKYKKNNNDYYKQLINVENNKTKDLLNQIYSVLKKKVEEKEREKEKEREREREKEKEKEREKEKQKEKEREREKEEEKKKKIKEIKDKENIVTKKEKENNIKKPKKNLKEIEIEEEYEEGIDIEEEYEEEEIKEVIIKKGRKKTEGQLSSTLGKKSVSKINQNIPMSQTFYKNNHKIIPKNENESDTEEKELHKEIKEIEKVIEGEKNKKKKKEKKIKKKEEEEDEEEIEIEEEVEEKPKKKRKSKTKTKSKEDSNSNDNKEKEKEKSIDKSRKKEKEKSQSSTNNDKSKTKNKKVKKKKKNESKEKEKNEDFSKKEKEYEFSVLSDQSKKSKLFSHVTQNSLSMDELSSIMSSGKTQKKLSQSQESIIDILTAPLKGSYLYTITNKGKLLSFNITHKKFAIVDSAIIDGWVSFVPNYLKNIEGSLLLNTLEGLFIVTGPNHNDLYFYSQEKNLIAQIISFNACHKYGGLLLSPSPDNTLFVIGGKNENNEVEHFSFDNDSCKSMPNLLTRRINASYTFINSKLYAIFGEDNNTIECLNIKKLKNKWTKIDYKMDDDKYINNIYGHVSLPVHDNDILIVGGKNNKKMMVLDLDEKTLDITDMKVPFIDVVGEYLFDKEKFFNQTVNEEKKDQEGKNIKELIGMDTSGNVHLFDYNFNYVVLLIKNQVKEK